MRQRAPGSTICILFVAAQCGVFTFSSCLLVTQNAAAQVLPGDPRFESIRSDGSGLLIGKLKGDTLLGGRLCGKGWVHLHPNGVPEAFTAATVIDLGRFTIPVGTWVRQDPKGVVTICAFPGNTEIQGHLCRGTGGPKGVSTAFYPSGALKQYFLSKDAIIQGIPCQAGLFSQSIELHENGRLKGCTLSADFEKDGQHWKKETRIQLEANGSIRH